MTDSQRLTFNRWFTALGMAALGVIALWVGSKIEALTVSVQKLTEQVARGEERTLAQTARMDRLEARQDRYEITNPKIVGGANVRPD